MKGYVKIFTIFFLLTLCFSFVHSQESQTAKLLALKTAQLNPILFLSAVPSDATLKSIISEHQPALYLNKGSDASPEKLLPRLEQVIGYLIQRESR